MIDVFVWPGLLQGNVGHASLRIQSTPSDPEEYCSWWPAGAGTVYDFLTGGAIPARWHTFAEDEEAEDNANFHTISIFGLDEPAMRAFWATWKADPTYRLYYKNCATSVMKLLAVGFHDQLTLNDDSLWTPFGVWMYAHRIYLTKKYL